jgi:hypothetical protein
VGNGYRVDPVHLGLILHESTYLLTVRGSWKTFARATAVVLSPPCGARIQRGTGTSSVTVGDADEDVRATARKG